MSAKLTIVLFILICLEIGCLLVVLPWVPYPAWNDNYLLVFAADKMHWPWFATTMKSGYARGAITGLGVLNIMLGVWEIIYFRRTAREFQMEWQSDESNTKPLDPVDTTHIRDNRSPLADQSNQPERKPGPDISN